MAENYETHIADCLPLSQLSKLCRYHVHITGFLVVPKPVVHSISVIEAQLRFSLHYLYF